MDEQPIAEGNLLELEDLDRPDEFVGFEHPTSTDRPRRTRLRSGSAGIALVLVAAVAGYAGGKLGDEGTTPASAPVSQSTSTSTGTVPATGLAALYARLEPSVVEIAMTGRAQGSGSGVIVDAAGVVLTNNHVVEGSSSARVTLDDGRTFNGTVAGRDPRWDLAAIRLSDPPSNLVAVKLGDSDGVVVGQEVIAIGSPFGLQGSLSAGVVSAVNRTFGGNDQTPPLRGLIQTDASINPGNSGGPLFNMSGDLIGITTAIESPVRGSVGVGFAVPINQAKSALPSLVKGQTVEHPFLGISGESADGGGVSIVDVSAGSSADRAGVKAGDVITTIAGVKVDSVDALAAELERHKVGGTVKLGILRSGRSISLNATLRAA